MQQIKIFKGVENELVDLETRVNAWLQQSGAKVVQALGNIAPQSLTQGTGGGLSKSYTPSDVLIVIVYEQA